MTDTPLHIKELQLKIWLDKTPSQRLKQFLIDNDALHKFWTKTKMPGSNKVIKEASSIILANSPVTK